MNGIFSMVRESGPGITPTIDEGNFVHSSFHRVRGSNPCNIWNLIRSLVRYIQEMLSIIPIDVALISFSALTGYVVAQLLAEREAAVSEATAKEARDQGISRGE